ncbi:helix-turn-helix domain-containing protein [Priestia koreensis]|uniref:helix-turn-helix domain-containing protein n=1 Tax=Priestia koreensis TaxID=284581 RepID=UPI003CFEB922
MPIKAKIKLKEVLKSRDLTQKQLAEMTGIREAAISSLVRNHMERVSLHHIEKIATVLEITNTNELIELVEED